MAIWNRMQNRRKNCKLPCVNGPLADPVAIKNSELN